VSTENNRERVIVITGGADNGAEIARMLAGKVSGDDYEVLTRDEAAVRGLLPEHFGDPVGLLSEPYPSKPRSHRPKPHPERDAWNAAVEAKKAAKRGRKAAA
jgi:hypothetical protein